MITKKELTSEILKLMDEFYEPMEMGVSCFDFYAEEDAAVCDTPINSDCSLTLSKGQYLVVEIYNEGKQAEIEQAYRKLSEPEVACVNSEGSKLLFYKGCSIEY